jgi:hypothetical protein
MKKIKCPVCKGKDDNCVACKGKGELTQPKPNNHIKDTDGKLLNAATKLRKRGYTLREIAGILGYKHPQSVQSLLNKNHITKIK